MPDPISSDAQPLDREQAQKRARSWQEAVVANCHPVGPRYGALEEQRLLAADLLAYEAELQRVERERDEAQAHLRAATDLVIRANKMIPGFASAWMPAILSDTEEARQRAARLEAQLAEARKALEFYASVTDVRAVSMILTDCGARARAALAASAETPEEPT